MKLKKKKKKRKKKKKKRFYRKEIQERKMQGFAIKKKNNKPRHLHACV
jgi:hypothetical protein